MNSEALNPYAGNRILLVEDDKSLARLLGDYLSKHGFTVTHMENGAKALQIISDEQFHLVILDVMLPGKSGLDVCREVRASYTGAIVMFTALGNDSDQMLGLEFGADDYIVKPVQPKLLLSRINALFRRMTLSGSQPHTSNKDEARFIQAGQLTINLNQRSVTASGQPVDLTSADFELLNILARNPGGLIEREIIVQELRGFDYDGIDRSIDRRVSRLRAKLQNCLGDVEIIKTIRGKGYQLCCGASDRPSPIQQDDASELDDTSE